MSSRKASRPQATASGARDATPLQRAAGPIVIAAAALAMLAWSWGTWPDVLVDFGRELYTAWRVSAGDALYRDVPHVHGPLSPLLNALGFRLFGVSLRTLVWVNLAVLAVLIALMYRLLGAVGTRLGATAALVVFVTLFAFARFVGLGNYNYVTPYRHEMTHGVTLAMAALACLAAHLRRPSPRWIAAAGALLGLVFLGKPDIFVAAAVAVAAGLAATLWIERPGWGPAGRIAAALVAPAAAVVLAATALLSVQVSWRTAVSGVWGPWGLAPNGAYRGSEFYASSLGLTGENVRLLFWVAGAWIAVLVPPLALAWARRSASWSRALTAVTCLGLVAALVSFVPLLGWLDALRPLPLAVVAILALTLAGLFRARADGDRAAARPLILTLSFALFALLLLAKILFRARLYHHGFVLGMPAALLVVVAIVDWIPAWIARRGGSAGLFRAAAFGVLGSALVSHLVILNVELSDTSYGIGTGGDAFRADEARGPAVREMLDVVERTVSPEQTLLALPEGLMLNYLARRVSPGPYAELLPTEVAYYGEDRILLALAAHPPDYVLLVHKDTSEYGARYFARDYGQRVAAWLHQNYQSVTLRGAFPFTDDRFGILLLKRADRPRS